MNAPVLVPLDGETDALQIAIKELSQRKIPLIIRRYLPDGSFEDWSVSELITDWGIPYTYFLSFLWYMYHNVFADSPTLLAVSNPECAMDEVTTSITASFLPPLDCTLQDVTFDQHRTSKTSIFLAATYIQTHRLDREGILPSACQIPSTLARAQAKTWRVYPSFSPRFWHNGPVILCRFRVSSLPPPSQGTHSKDQGMVHIMKQLI